MNKMQRKTKIETPNEELMAALREYPEMKKNKKRYKRYKSFAEILK